MRKNIGRKSWFYPLPIFIIGTYDENGTPNAVNALDGRLYRSDMIEISISRNGTAYKNVLQTKAFTVNFSENFSDARKQKEGWTAIHSQFVNAPVFDEFPVVWECEFVRITEDGNVLGKLKNISANESVLNEKGLVATDQFKKFSA